MFCRSRPRCDTSCAGRPRRPLSSRFRRWLANVERLRELDQMKTDFVAVTSHELRTPLTSVHGFIRTLRRPGISLSSTEVQEFLAIVDRQTERLTRLVEDLLLTARIEAGAI